MQFHKLSVPWQEVMHEVVLAYKSNCFPIGAIIFNEKLEVVARGRNSIHDYQEDQPVSLHELAHAEINALLQVSKFDFSGLEKYHLFTSLEPCIACFGAFVMSRIMTLSFGARDAFAGATEARDANGYVERRGNQISGPNAAIEGFQLALLTDFVCRKLPHDMKRVLGPWYSTSPTAVGVGIALSQGTDFYSFVKTQTTEETWDFVQKKLKVIHSCSAA